MTFNAVACEIHEKNFKSTCDFWKIIQPTEIEMAVFSVVWDAGRHRVIKNYCHLVLIINKKSEKRFHCYASTLSQNIFIEVSCEVGRSWPLLCWKEWAAKTQVLSSANIQMWPVWKIMLTHLNSNLNEFERVKKKNLRRGRSEDYQR